MRHAKYIASKLGAGFDSQVSSRENSFEVIQSVVRAGVVTEGIPGTVVEVFSLELDSQAPEHVVLGKFFFTEVRFGSHIARRNCGGFRDGVKNGDRFWGEPSKRLSRDYGTEVVCLYEVETSMLQD
jgi:hypothetical protein